MPELDKPYSDPARWLCVYPIYINSEKTVEKGRRIAKEKAVRNPTAKEIYDVLVAKGFTCRLDAKTMHPREPSREPADVGRVKVQLKNDDGSFVKEDFKNRRDILLLCAQLIPNLTSRKQQGQAPAQPGPSATGKGKNKKKR
ncbi:unnamed protein product [Bursaphelenchus xylophilus]|uniref:(pine wood nematode) hypothetical protein n=1 Tax=Bursaphelenchus xylophilus TaxID=6326 RepID=A0A1I7S1H8_BURXY|nr:unnamed protein product [Bursaphelenchus xylophilus]CAG9081472.1 unnamed protein product [Bursaphelenchus xylophilus]